MDAVENVHIGLLAPQTATEPHFAGFRKLLPANISLTIEGRSLAHTSRYEFAGRTDEFVARAVDFVERHKVQGLIVAGAPVTLLNPDLEARLAHAIRVPTVTAVAAAAAALKALSARRLILVTPFDSAINHRIEAYLRDRALSVLFSPLFEDQEAGGASKTDPNELFERVKKILTEHPAADAIYFQGAALDPLPIMDRMEKHFEICVVASNPAMLWHLLSRMGHRHCIDGYGKLLSSWPVPD